MSTGLAAFTLFHVALSLVGIFTGFVVLFALKIFALKVLAPTQSQPLFLPGGVHVGFHSPWVLAVKRFPGEAVHAA